MPKSKKRAASSDSDSDSGPEDRNPKKQATDKKADKKGEKKTSKSSDSGEKVFPLDRKKQVSVKEFRGVVYVDIREYYEKDGELLPTKKGIFLTATQWNKLKDLTSDIDDALAEF